MRDSRGGGAGARQIGGGTHGDKPADGPQRPDRLPQPGRAAQLYRRLREAGAPAHPVYSLSKMVAWYEEWMPTGGKRSPSVKAHAFGAAQRDLTGTGLSELAERARARREAWLAPLERRSLARRLVLTARTDAVVWLVSPGPLELGLALHHVYGFPVLPATSLKGLARRVSQRHTGQTVADRSYGSQECVAVALILVGRGHADSLDAVVEDLRHGLDERGLGAKTAAGYGVFGVEAAPLALGSSARPFQAREAQAGLGREAQAAPGMKPEEAAEPPKRSVHAESVEATIKRLRHQDVKPHLKDIAAQIGQSGPEEQGDLVKFFYGRLRELGFKEKEIRDLFGRYPDLGVGGGL